MRTNASRRHSRRCWRLFRGKGACTLPRPFHAFNDRYVLIGGTACDLLMSDAGLAFRATRDLDIVLCLEALDREFAEARLGGGEL